MCKRGNINCAGLWFCNHRQRPGFDEKEKPGNGEDRLSSASAKRGGQESADAHGRHGNSALSSDLRFLKHHLLGMMGQEGSSSAEKLQPWAGKVPLTGLFPWQLQFQGLGKTRRGAGRGSSARTGALMDA